MSREEVRSTFDRNEKLLQVYNVELQTADQRGVGFEQIEENVKRQLKIETPANGILSGPFRDYASFLPSAYPLIEADSSKTSEYANED